MGWRKAALQNKEKVMDLEKMKKVEDNGLRHGLIKVLANSVKDDGMKHVATKNKDKFAKEKKRDNELVEARFIKFEHADQPYTMPYCNWAGDPLLEFKFYNNQTYLVPMGLVNDINHPRRRNVVRSEILGPNGMPTVKDSAGTRPFEFIVLTQINALTA